jgi:hypothetical protein
VADRLGSGDTGTMTGLADRGADLSLPPLTWLLEVPVLPEIGENPRLLALLLESFERPLETLVIVNDDFWHFLTHPSPAR